MNLYRVVMNLMKEGPGYYVLKREIMIVPANSAGEAHVIASKSKHLPVEAIIRVAEDVSTEVCMLFS